jgi:hypothetical protein
MACSLTALLGNCALYRRIDESLTMQFGKFHGWAFIALGALLLLVQLGLYFAPKQDAARSPENPAPAGVHKTTLVPGVVGGLSLILGIGLCINNRHKPQE